MSPIGDPQPTQTTEKRVAAAAAAPTNAANLSARYIDSRLKQFCYR